MTPEAVMAKRPAKLVLEIAQNGDGDCHSRRAYAPGTHGSSGPSGTMRLGFSALIE